MSTGNRYKYSAETQRADANGLRSKYEKGENTRKKGERERERERQRKRAFFIGLFRIGKRYSAREFSALFVPSGFSMIFITNICDRFIADS